MQTHEDFDSNDTFDELRKEAERLTARGENLITAGAPHEPLLYDRQSGGFTVRQLPRDPFALRISIGEAHDGMLDSAYLVFRGDRDAVTGLLRRSLLALESAPR